MSKKSFFSFIKNNRKKCIGLLAAAICLGVYAAAGDMVPDKSASDDIPIHDGDVLVDSLNISEESKDSEGNVDESSLVTSDEVAEIESNSEYFQELRATLDMDRNQILALLSDTESSASTKAEKEEASAEKMRLLNYMEQEKVIENLIRNKGLPECFVIITDSGVNVTVDTQELDQSTVTKICEIIMRQTDRKASEIVVQEAS